jgi:hypothetical protein
MDSLTFDLSKPIKVQLNVDGKNDFVDIDKIYFSAPSYKHRDLTIGLKKKFIEAVFAMTASLPKDEAQKQVNDDNGKLDAKSIKAILYAAKDFDIVSFFKKFEAFLISEIAFKDEEKKQKLVALDLQRLDESDFEELLAKYLEVFFIVSWMKTLS